MSIETHKSPTTPGHGDYERRDISPKGIFYFLVGLAVAVVLIHLFLIGMYDYLDKREKANQAPANPLILNAPADTRRVLTKYPETIFPDPRLETDEGTQLNDIRLAEEQTLNSYGWIDQKAGTAHIPIEHAMDLLVQRGLPVRSPDAGLQSSPARSASGQPGKKAKRSEQ